MLSFITTVSINFQPLYKYLLHKCFTFYKGLKLNNKMAVDKLLRNIARFIVQSNINFLSNNGIYATKISLTGLLLKNVLNILCKIVKYFSLLLIIITIRVLINVKFVFILILCLFIWIMFQCRILWQKQITIVRLILL